MNQETFKLTITSPCTKNWDAMLPTNEGKHCNSCKKDVIDFSRMNDEEVKNYFLQNKDTPTCGRFYSNQLDRIKIHLSQNILYSDISYWKKYIIILMICFGVHLFSVEVVLGQTIDSLPIKDSINTVDTLKATDTIKNVDTLQPIVTGNIIKSELVEIQVITMGDVTIGDEICNVLMGFTQTLPHEPITTNVWTTMGIIGPAPKEPKTLMEILREDSTTNEKGVTISSNYLSSPANKKPIKKQEPQQQQEFTIPDEIKIKRRK